MLFVTSQLFTLGGVWGGCRRSISNTYPTAISYFSQQDGQQCIINPNYKLALPSLVWLNRHPGIRDRIYFSEGVKQDQTAHTCRLIFLYTLRYFVMYRSWEVWPMPVNLRHRFIVDGSLRPDSLKCIVNGFFFPWYYTVGRMYFTIHTWKTYILEHFQRGYSFTKF